jgi:UDP-N-acetylmuramyl pentapeptide phosphotransferase/UDP-N-acetylglucosamine-1-phosphate transferase
MTRCVTDLWSVLAACSASFLIAAVGTGLLRRALASRGIVDKPNTRSSHHTTTPRGGGIAVVGAIAGGLALLSVTVGLPAGAHIVIPAALILAVVSWIDDVRGLPAWVRFLSHAVCVGASLYWLALPVPALLEDLPSWAQSATLAIAWLWFLNLYNFMDGIDGITGVETMTITLGVALVSGLASGGALVATALVVAAAMPGFLIWNWPPAKIFMGDIGSVTLGYLVGWLLLTMAGDGALIAALLLPGYYVADATITLFRRALRGEKIWQAHRQHAYQAAVQNGMSHGGVSARVGILGACLIGLALISTVHPWPALAAGVVMTVAMLHHLSRKNR